MNQYDSQTKYIQKPKTWNAVQFGVCSELYLEILLFEKKRLITNTTYLPSVNLKELLERYNLVSC